MKLQWNRKLVLVKTFNNEVSARIAQSFVEASEIQSVVLKDDEGWMTPQLQFTNGVRLLVDEEKAESAVKLLHKCTWMNPSNKQIESIRSNGLQKHRKEERLPQSEKRSAPATITQPDYSARLP